MMERDEFISRVCAALDADEHLVREMYEAERPAREEAQAEEAAFREFAVQVAEKISAELTEKLRATLDDAGVVARFDQRSVIEP